MPAWQSYILMNSPITPPDLDKMPLDKALDYCEALNVKAYNKAMAHRVAIERSKPTKNA